MKHAGLHEVAQPGLMAHDRSLALEKNVFAAAVVIRYTVKESYFFYQYCFHSFRQVDSF